MGKTIEFPTTAKLKELETELAEVHAKIDALEHKMKLSCRSGIPLKDDTKEGLFGLLAQSVAIADEIGRLRGFDEEKWLEEYNASIEKHDQRMKSMFAKELAAMPKSVDEKRLYLYSLAEQYLLQTKEAIENDDSYEIIYDEWDKFAFFYELVTEYDAPVFQELGDDELVTCAELYRLEELSLYHICQEMLNLFSEKEKKLASADKGRYIGQVFTYYRATLHAIDDNRLK